jgi:predicted RNA-binding Zn ribbon-like protein
MAEPLPIAFANTLHAVRGRVRDGLTTPSELASWLDSVADQLPAPASSAAISHGDLARARELRDAIRAIAVAVVSGDPPAPPDIDILNEAARDAPKWRELHWEPQPHATEHSAGATVAAALSAIADQAVALFAGDLRSEIRACHGPGCVLHFVRDSPRREWCSPGCGNRARAARHYARTRPGSPG